MMAAASENRAARNAPADVGVPGWMIDATIAIALALVAVAVYVNSLHPTFVYDDERQIVQNVFLQDGGLFWKAMFSDVWAFKGARAQPWSNYWRPTFVLWMMANAKLFGLGSAVGWHATNLLLHALVVALAYGFLRRLKASRAVAGAITLVFAVHPVHVESVAWVSGSPDMLLAGALLGSWMLFMSARAKGGGGWRLAASLGLYGVALLAKEVAVLFPAVLFVAVGALERPGERLRAWRGRALRAVAPYVVLAAAYLVARSIVLRGFQDSVPGNAGWLGLILSAPEVAAFYLRQALFPLTIGPSYTLRPVTPGTIGLMNFALPLAVDAVAACAAIWIARRDAFARIGLALAVCTLAPAMNINAFIPEQIVHDRYLYLPLLGGLMALFAGISMGLRRLPALRQWRAEAVCVGLAVVASVPLTLVTVSYNRAWGANLALWERALATDPTSAFNWNQYGVYLNEAGRLDEARKAFDRALEIHPYLNAYMGRAEVEMARRHFADAEADLKTVLATFDDWAAYERLAVCYQNWGRLDKAEETLRTAREKIPYMRAAFTENLAVVLYQQGRKQAAIDELEAVRPEVDKEFGPGAKLVLYRLGLLYEEQPERADEARRALRAYLAATDRMTDARSRAAREQARLALRRLGSTP